MPIVEFSNLNKYGNIRTRRFYQEKSNFGINPKGFGPFIAYRLFKYTHEHDMAPALTNINGKKYILPTWQEVLPETTLKDIDWVKPKPKIRSKPLIEIHTSNSSPDISYKTKYFPDTGNFSCQCPGTWRAPNGKCKHIKALEEKVK